ncbi:MAG: molybdopterin-binding protein [Gammaproteobacteria bacterium]
MTADNRSGRRRFLAGTLGTAGALLLSGCDYLSRSQGFVKLLEGAEKLSSAAQHLVTSRSSLAQEFTEADLSPFFRSNGTSNPENPAYQALAQNEFADYRLKVAGRVKRPTAFSLAQLRELPSRTQITRHDCVEGWSAIGKWKGAKLAALLERVQPLPNARYVVFHCADPMDDAGTLYYESIDMEDAYHPQTILAYEMNDQTLPIKNGAPIRVRIERQLGYKMAKYIMRIELVESFAHIGGGKGGYWEDDGYEWYAGI